MIAITAKHTIQPQRVDTYLNLMRELAENTRLEPGCIGYYVVQSQENTQEHTLFEFWRSQGDLDAHMKTEHFQRIVPLLPTTFAADEAVTQYQLIV